MARPKKNVITLTDEQVKKLKTLIKTNSVSETMIGRCRILLDMDEAHKPVFSQEECVQRNGICRATVNNVVSLFCREGFDSVLKTKRNINSDNARRKVDGRCEAKIIEIACGPVPEGHSRWTIRLLEESMKVVLDEPVSREAIRRALKKTHFDLTGANTGVYQVKQMQNS